MDMRFIEQCERERLHLSGAIQPHGFIVVTDDQQGVTHVSANLATYLPPVMCMAPGDPLVESFGHWLRMLESSPGNRWVQAGALEGRDGTIDLVVTRMPQGGWVFEGYPAGGVVHPLDRLPRFRPVPEDASAMHQARQELVELLADTSGFERVLYYRFREDEDGEVLAEARRGEAYGSYLGLRFPASDIPRIARDLYRRNPWRQIPDARADAVPVQGPGAPDLSLADLRSVSPVHRIYLANMGVRASLSLPVLVGDNLRALIACHHSQPRLLAVSRLEGLAQRVRDHAMLLSAYESRRHMRLVDDLPRRFANLLQVLARHGDPLAAWPELAPLLLMEFAVDGAVFSGDGQQAGWGLALEPGALEVLDAWLEQADEVVWHTDHLCAAVPGMPVSEVAGVLAIRVSTLSGRIFRVYLCRQEYLHEVAWGGNPDKPVEHHDGQLGIAPRRSFEKWVELRLGYSRSWDNESRLLAYRLRECLAAAITRV